MVEKLREIITSLEVDESTTLDRINDYLFGLYNKPRKGKRKPSLSPSSLGAKCLRKVYYGYWKVEPDYPIRDSGARVFATGDMYEEMLMGWLKAIGEHIPFRNLDGQIPVRFGKVDPQFEISSERWQIRSGLIDNVAIVDGKLWIYEIKSSNEKKFKDQIGPQEQHKYQASVYFTAFNEMLAAGKFAHIPELKGFTKAVGVKYFYINKNNSQIKEYIVEGATLTNHIAAIEQRVEVIEGFNKEKKLPPATEDYCFFCNFKLKCKRGWNEV